MPSSQAPPANTLKTPEAAAYIGKSEPWLRQSRVAGSDADAPPYVRIGRTVVYLRDDLDAFLAAHRVQAGESE